MNILIINGCLGKDPEVRVTGSGHKVTSFSLASSIGSGEKKTTVWWRVCYWGERFDKLLPYLKKGTWVTVNGTLSRPPAVFTPNGGIPQVGAIEITAEMIHLGGGAKKEEKPVSNDTHVTYEDSHELPF